MPTHTPDPLTLSTADAVLCDFNGTLSRDEDLLQDLVQAIAAERLGRHLDPDTYRDHLAGLSDREIFTRLTADQGPRGAMQVPGLVAELSSRYRARASDGHLVPHPARALLRGLSGAGVPLALVTGAGRAAVLPPLRAAGVAELFQVVLTEEDVTVGKPDPEGYRTAARMLCAQPARTVVLEDSLPGLAAATAAGMPAVAVRGTHPERILAAHAVLRVDQLSPSLATLPLPAAPTARPTGRTDPVSVRTRSRRRGPGRS